MSDYLRNPDNKSNINDGFFEIKFLNDGIYLTVYPALVSGRKTDVREVIDRLNRKHIRGYKKEYVEILVAKANKIPVKIAELQEEIKIDAAASVIVAPDKMKAFITITAPEGGRMLAAGELLGVLNKNNVVYGIKKTALEQLEKYPVYNEMVCIAEGILSANGVNGKIDFHFDLDRIKKPTILGDGRVDYRELNLIQNVKKDQILCTLIPPKEGKKGINVFGIDMPALDGKPAVLPRGKNVEVSPDGQSLLSKVDGQVNYIDGKVSVFATYEVMADVDNTTGNIYFVGNVVIRGNVLSGFVVEAGGNVEVWGVVEGAVIKAGGDIILRHGIQGSGKGILSSGGDIVARYIENSNVEAGNDIKSEAIMHSNFKCGNKLELSGKKGLLVGGSCKVGREITAKVIGSYMATLTEIEVGVDTALRGKIKSIRDEMSSMEIDLKKAEQAITILQKLEYAGALTPQKQEMLERSLRTQVYYSNRLTEMRDELQLLEGSLPQNSNGKVRCYNIAYPGTKVVMGSSIMYVRENLQYCSLYSDGADVRVGDIDR
jgi:uncharacterized protein (DUF342 family)